MGKKNKKIRRGLTLVEVTITMVFLIVLVLGTMGFSYYSAMDARKADIKSSAARLCSAILEDWKGTGGRTDYDAVDSFGTLLDISEIGDKDKVDFSSISNMAGLYHAEVNHANYYIVLWYENPTSVKPQTLNVRVSWMQSYSTWDDSGPKDSVTLSTYVEN